MLGWFDAAALASTEWLYLFTWAGSGADEFQTRVYDGAGNPLATNAFLSPPAATTDYQLAIVLGGYDVNATPFYAGQTPADYLYGAAFFIKGGAFGSNWTLLWRTALGNTATLYAAFSNYDASGTLD